MLFFSVWYHGKLNIFAFWTVGWKINQFENVMQWAVFTILQEKSTDLSITKIIVNCSHKVMCFMPMLEYVYIGIYKKIIKYW